jgi:CheY-like chemotaxis protein
MIKKILVVDDEPLIRNFLNESLTRLKKEVHLFIYYLQVENFYKDCENISKILYNLDETDYIVLKK